MSARDRASLIARIRQVGRATAAPASPRARPGDSDGARVADLETRVGHLEQLLEGLQDSVHREAERHARMIAELQAQIHPAAMSAALRQDARQRGL